MRKKKVNGLEMAMFIISMSFVFFTAGCPKKQTLPPDQEKKEVTQPAPPKATEELKKETLEPTPPSTQTPAPSPTPVTPPPPPLTAPSPMDQKLISIANGEILLNPKLKEDAQLIQKRLSDLGLYKGPIDGIWGRGSEAALKAFKTENALSNPFRWDKEAQMLLFREMPPDPEVMKRAISKGEIFLNPLIPQDAKLIQSRLLELGFYKGPIDGIWGRGSEAALKAFKEKNNLENPTQWDKETQMNLFR